MQVVTAWDTILSSSFFLLHQLFCSTCISLVERKNDDGGWI